MAQSDPYPLGFTVDEAGGIHDARQSPPPSETDITSEAASDQTVWKLDEATRLRAERDEARAERDQLREEMAATAAANFRNGWKRALREFAPDRVGEGLRRLDALTQERKSGS